MRRIIAVHFGSAPAFTAQENHPDAERFQFGANWVDAIGGQPTQEEYEAASGTGLLNEQAALWGAIKAERDRRIQTGGYEVGTKWFHSDTFSRTQQMGLVMLGASIPAGTQWKTMDGSFVTMTQTLAAQIFAAGAASDIAIFTNAQLHRTAMEALADPTGYDFSTGWPAAFPG